MSLATPDPDHRPKFYTVELTATDSAVEWDIPSDAVGMRISVRTGGSGNVYVSTDGTAASKLDITAAYNLGSGGLRIPTEINNVVPRAEKLYFDVDGTGAPATVEIVVY